MSVSRKFLFALFCAAGTLAASAAEVPGPLEFHKDIRPILENYCFDCHADGANKGNLVGDHMYSVTSINAAAGTVTLHNPWGANAAGAGVAEDFTVTLSQLESENVGFYNAVGKAATA